MDRWNTLKDLLSIQDRVNRLYEDALVSDNAVRETAAGIWSPLTDIYETETGFVVVAEVPEVKQSDIDIKLQDGVLVIEGERRFQHTTMEGCYRIERAYGRFQRSFPLPYPVEQDKIKATLTDGVLRIILPKATEAKPAKIKITGD